MRTLLKTAALAPIIAAAALTLAPAAAHAETARAVVNFADLDLTTPAGKAELNARVERAARTYCTPNQVTGTRITGRADPACVADVRGRINAQLAARAKRGQPAALASRQP